MFGRMTPHSSTRSNHYWLAFGWFGVVLLCLAPWWRNHAYIRDFFDYGLMILAAGRINDGQLPFTDWDSPLQTGSYWLNALAENWLGGDYLGLSRGNALFIPFAIVLLAVTLRRQGSPIGAMFLVFCIVVGSASQHTLIWYNAIGAVTLAAIAWTTACHPVVIRRGMGAAALVVAMLIWSGINKINFHALALAVACGWTLRAGILGTAAWRQVISTLGVWLVAGLIIPVLLELQLTGASFAQWKYNVFELPFSAPGYEIERFLTFDFLLTHINDHYGPTLQPVGLILVIWAGVTVGLAWSRCSGMDRLLLLGAAIMALGGTFALIATNHEIVYVGLASGVALLTSLWIGFGLWERAHLRNWLLIAPAALLSTIMFYSAWLGQRSQFGHQSADRSTYKKFSKGDADAFRYLVGTYIPSSIHDSLIQLDQFIPSSNGNGRIPVFYSTGAEFLERIWPNRILPGMPLLVASLTVSEQRAKELSNAFAFPPEFKMLVGIKAWTGSWPGDLHLVVQRNSTRQDVGVFQVHRFSGDWLQAGLPPLDDALAALNSFQGNMDPAAITVDEPLWPLNTPSGRPLMGTYEKRGSFTFTKPSFRIAGEIALQRSLGAPERPLSATFSVYDGTIPEGQMGSLIWSETHTLDPAEDFQTASFQVDSRGRPARFVVTVADDSIGDLRAGFFLPRIGHSDPTPTPPPTLRLPVPEPFANTPELANALLPEDWQEDMEVVARGATLEGGNLILDQGGELWLKPKRPISELHGQISLTAPPEQSGAPVARVVWYRGGRMEVLMQSGINPPDRPLSFRCWPAEDDGWYGILIDPTYNPHGLKVEITSVNPR